MKILLITGLLLLSIAILHEHAGQYWNPFHAVPAVHTYEQDVANGTWDRDKSY